MRLESQVRLEVLSDFSDQALEWQFADQEFGRFLVFSVKISEGIRRKVRDYGERENWAPEARSTPAHFFEDDIYSSIRQEYTRKRCTVALKKHFHARQRSHARDRSPSTPRVKEKTNLLISKTPPKLTKIGAKTGQKQRSLLTESLSTLRCPAYICAASSHHQSLAQICARPSSRVVFSGLSRRWIYERFVWYEPFVLPAGFFVPSTKSREMR